MRGSLIGNKWVRIFIVTSGLVGFASGLWLSTYVTHSYYKDIVHQKNVTIGELIEEIKHECSELYGYSKQLEQENKILRERNRDFESIISN
tara:strand:+ start:301 stop:573 length:273 start_codon:yes stop_codon:yes gene_type:complete